MGITHRGTANIPMLEGSPLKGEQINSNNSKPYSPVTMHLAYSAINQTNSSPQGGELSPTENERLLRYHAYQQTCEKYRHQIAAIQKYMPGWLPKFQ